MMHLNLQDIGCILSIMIFVLFCFCISGWFFYYEIKRIKQRLYEDEEAIKATWEDHDCLDRRIKDLEEAFKYLEERFREIDF